MISPPSVLVRGTARCSTGSVLIASRRSASSLRVTVVSWASFTGDVTVAALAAGAGAG